MRRSTLILLLVLAVIVLGGGAYLWWQKDSLSWPWSTGTGANTNTVTNTVVNLNPPTNTNTTLPTEVKGEKPVTGTLTNGAITVTFNSQSRVKSSDGLTADKGETLLLLYFDPVAAVSGSTVTAFLKDVRLTDGQNTYTLKALRVASATVTNDRGHLTFLVPDDAKNLVLELGSGATVQRVTVP